MRAHEFIIEAKFKPTIDDYLNTPYDADEEEWHNRTEPHRGPQEGRYLNAMLKGIKPITILDNGDIYASKKALFKKYIDNGTLKLAMVDGDDWYITLPGEEWRAPKLKELFNKVRKIRHSADTSTIAAEKILDAKIGLLLGIPKESVKYFIDNF